MKEQHGHARTSDESHRLRNEARKTSSTELFQQVSSGALLKPNVIRRKRQAQASKVTRNLPYLEARKIVEHTPETTFSTIVQSAIARPETKHDYTQTSDNDKIISSSTKVLIPTKYKTNKSQPSSKATTPQSKQTASKPKPTAQANTSKIEQPKKQRIKI